jgi:hypothetical protein
MTLDGGDPQCSVPSQHVKIGIGMEDRNACPDRMRGDEAIDELPNRLAATPARTVQECRVFEVGGPSRHD